MEIQKELRTEYSVIRKDHSKESLNSNGSLEAYKMHIPVNQDSNDQMFKVDEQFGVADDQQAGVYS